MLIASTCLALVVSGIGCRQLGGKVKEAKWRSCRAYFVTTSAYLVKFQLPPVSHRLLLPGFAMFLQLQQFTVTHLFAKHVS